MTAMHTYRGTNEITDAASLFTLPTDRTTWSYDQPTGLLTNKLYADDKGPVYTYTADGKLATRAWVFPAEFSSYALPNYDCAI